MAVARLASPTPLDLFQGFILCGPFLPSLVVVSIADASRK
jgi:hypothetical protein